MTTNFQLLPEVVLSFIFPRKKLKSLEPIVEVVIVLKSLSTGTADDDAFKIFSTLILVD